MLADRAVSCFGYAIRDGFWVALRPGRCLCLLGRGIDDVCRSCLQLSFDLHLWHSTSQVSWPFNDKRQAVKFRQQGSHMLQCVLVWILCFLAIKLGMGACALPRDIYQAYTPVSYRGSMLAKNASRTMFIDTLVCLFFRHNMLINTPALIFAY